ncbi:SDR family oxidoreductase [soil metagenome]
MPRPNLKPIAEQVVVVTGATSGIGLATARLAAERGAAVFLISRNADALKRLTDEFRAKGGRADHAVADVGEEVQLRAAAAKCDAVFGGFDTWVNNAGVSIFGRIEDTPLEDQRRLFDTNYWGVVHGSRLAVERLRARPGGGALINLGSILSDFPVPVQGIYSASKHAVKGFTNALRQELFVDAPQVSVTLIKPAAIDTPYKEHARNYMGAPGTNPPPVYATPLVAEAIVYAAETPTREITVGGGGKLQALFGVWFPRLSEAISARIIPPLLKDKAANHPADSDALYAPGRDLRERAPYPMVREVSWYSRAQQNPQTTAAAIGGGLALLWIWSSARRALRHRHIRHEAVRRYLED